MKPQMKDVLAKTLVCVVLLGLAYWIAWSKGYQAGLQKEKERYRPKLTQEQVDHAREKVKGEDR